MEETPDSDKPKNLAALSRQWADKFNSVKRSAKRRAVNTIITWLPEVDSTSTTTFVWFAEIIDNIAYYKIIILKQKDILKYYLVFEYLYSIFVLYLDSFFVFISCINEKQITFTTR